MDITKQTIQNILEGQNPEKIATWYARFEQNGKVVGEKTYPNMKRKVAAERANADAKRLRASVVNFTDTTF